MSDWDGEIGSVDVAGGAGDVLPCPACGVEVYDDAERCPACGHWITDAERFGRSGGHRAWVKWVAVGLVVVLVVLATAGVW